MKIPNQIRKLSRALRDGLKRVLKDNLYGIYIYGALAFPETGPTGDIDFHVLLKHQLSDSDKLNLENLHNNLARDYPPLGVDMDGYYILLHEARRTNPPQHQLCDNVYDNSWALHRAHIRAGRCIILFGPDPKTVYPPTSWAELEEALEGELDYIKSHLAEYPGYCVLNLCRLIYSHRTRDVVVSKMASADWAQKEFAEWKELIRTARRSYAHEASPTEIEFLGSHIGQFLNFASCEIQRCKRER